MGNQLGSKSVTLTLTEVCNLACSYCYEANKNTKYMTFDTARQIIDHELNIDDGFDHVLIDFFGGEPFIAFDLMKQIVEYLKNNKFKKTFELSTITNGTLVHGDIKQWLIENSDFITVSLSLDGNKHMHDINRNNSFDSIDLEFFSKYYGKHGVKMTISLDTLPYLYEGVVFCQEHGFDVYCNLAFGIDWSLPENITILSRELEKLIDYYLAHPEYKPCSILDLDISLLGYDNPKIHYKWCGVKSHMHTYDVQGKEYPCQYFMGITCGDNKKIESSNIEFPIEVPIDVLSEECQKCAINIICPTCYGANYISTGNIYCKDMSMCELNKVIIKARSFFKFFQWKNGLIELNNKERTLLLKSIKKVQTELK